jgi:hypothetical protein
VLLATTVGLGLSFTRLSRLEEVGASRVGYLALLGHWLPEDTWMGMAALSGSWIGGTANMVAIKESVGTPDSLMGPIIIVDTAVGYGWVGVLRFFSAWQHRFDAFVKADTRALEDVNKKLAAADETRRPTELRDMGVILALGFGGAFACIWLGDQLPELGDPKIVSHTVIPHGRCYWPPRWGLASPSRGCRGWRRWALHASAIWRCISC